jgi:hypothetical protein
MFAKPVPVSPCSPGRAHRLRQPPPSDIDSALLAFCSAVRGGLPPSVPAGDFPDVAAASAPVLADFAAVLCGLFCEGGAPARHAILQLIAAQPTDRLLHSLLAHDFFKAVFAVWAEEAGAALLDAICRILLISPRAVSLVYAEQWMVDPLCECVRSAKRPPLERQIAALAISYCAGPGMPGALRGRVLQVARDFFADLRDDFISLPGRLMTNAEWSRYILNDLDFFSDFYAFMQSDDNRHVRIAITTIGQYFLYCEESLPIDMAMITRLLRSQDEEVSSCALWLVSNMIPAAPEMIDALELFEIVNGRRDGSTAQRVGASWVLEAIVRAGTGDQILRAVEECECIEVFLDVCGMEHPKNVQGALAAMARIFGLADVRARESCAAKFVEADGPAVLRELAESSGSAEVRAAAEKALALVPVVGQDRF